MIWNMAVVSVDAGDGHFLNSRRTMLLKVALLIGLTLFSFHLASAQDEKADEQQPATNQASRSPKPPDSDKQTNNGAKKEDKQGESTYVVAGVALTAAFTGALVFATLLLWW